ncbi:MAG: hypothetical protein V4598_10815 [Bdellovibrionota bacterium]
MKYSILLALLFSFSAMAKTPSLFVKDSGKLLDVEELIAAEEDIQSVYGFESFCYKGDPSAVMTKIRSWKKKGQFFSGDGGGHVLRSLTLIRGIVTYDIALKFEDEVVPGEFETQIVKPCTK